MLGSTVLFVNDYVLAQPSQSDRPVRLVVPFPAGGATDFVARAVGDALSKRWGKAVIVENRTGAAGVLGVSEAAKALPDGNTILLTVSDTLINNVLFIKNLPYAPDRDFAFVGQVARSTSVIVANSDIPVTNLREFFVWAAERKGQLSYVTPGVGTRAHIVLESLNKQLSLGMVHSPQRGESLVVTDLISNVSNIGMAAVSSAAPQIRAGKLKALAVIGSSRSAALPDVPSSVEMGLTDPIYSVNTWMGVLVPAKTPQHIAVTLAQDLQLVMADAKIRSSFQERGFEPMATKPAEFEASYRAEFKAMDSKVASLNIDPSK
jgi:tripartite-type tricarboxylate transporter receptor subunit TctC